MRRLEGLHGDGTGLWAIITGDHTVSTGFSFKEFVSIFNLSI